MIRRPPTAIFLGPEELQADLHRIYLTLYFTHLRLDGSSQSYEEGDEQQEEDSTLIASSNPSPIDSCASAASTISDVETDIHGDIGHTANWMGHAINIDITRVPKTVSWKDVRDATPASVLNLTRNETPINTNTNKAPRSMGRVSQSVDSLRRKIPSSIPSSQTKLGTHNGNAAVATGSPLADVSLTTVSGASFTIDAGQITRDSNRSKSKPNPHHAQSARCATTSEIQALTSATSPSIVASHSLP